MTATLEEVRAALAVAVRTTGIRCSEYLTNQVAPPMAMINIEGPTQYTFPKGGRHQYTAEILVFDQLIDARSAQMRFDELRDPFHPRSLVRAVGDNAALNALPGVDYARLSAPDPMSDVAVSNTSYLLVRWPLEFMIHQEAP